MKMSKSILLFILVSSITSCQKSKNIPIHIGEFGAYSKADMDSRVKWTRFLSRWFEQQGFFSWAYWEWNSSFGIYDPQTKTYRTQLVNALTKDAMPASQSVN
jgi:endoglucanase